MTEDLVTLRAVLLSGSGDDRDLFRQAAASMRIPFEVVETPSVASACETLTGGADLLFIDGACSSAEVARVAAAARAAAKPPFVILLAARDATAAAAAGPDAIAAKPTQFDEAKRLIERSMWLRIPSRTLVADDSATTRRIVRKILMATRFPFTVTEVAEGFAALKLVSEGSIDIVIVDYDMPGFRGLQTLHRFKRVRRHLTVVVMSSAEDKLLAERVRTQGGVFLKKPFFPADLEAALTEHYGLTVLNPARA